MLKIRLKALGIKHVQLAARLGVARTTINRRVAADDPEMAAWLAALEMLSPEDRERWMAGAARA